MATFHEMIWTSVFASLDIINNKNFDTAEPPKDAKMKQQIINEAEQRYLDINLDPTC